MNRNSSTPNSKLIAFALALSEAMPLALLQIGSILYKNDDIRPPTEPFSSSNLFLLEAWSLQLVARLPWSYIFFPFQNLGSILYTTSLK